MSQSFEDLDIASLIAEVEQASAPEALGSAATAAEISGWIQRRVAKELNCDPARISATAPLTELGVSSIASLTITGCLAEALGRELPNTLLWEHPTIASVAAFLGSDVEHAPDPIDDAHRRRAIEFGISEVHYQRLFEDTATWASERVRPGFLANVISEHPGTVPVFWIGDFKGSHPLAEKLNQTVLAQPSGYRLLRHTAENILSLARLYAWEITQLVAAGSPFIIAGYCFGGKLAVETARLLHGQGLGPRQVVLVECAGPDEGYWRAYRTRRSLRRVHKQLLHHGRLIAKGNALRQMAGLASRFWQRQTRLEEAASTVAPDTYEETSRHWEYQPEPIGFTLTLVFARETFYRLPLFAQFGWSRHLGSPANWVTLPGDHFSIIEPRDVAHLARLLSEVSTTN